MPRKTPVYGFNLFYHDESIISAEDVRPGSTYTGTLQPDPTNTLNYNFKLMEELIQSILNGSLAFTSLRTVDDIIAGRDVIVGRYLKINPEYGIELPRDHRPNPYLILDFSDALMFSAQDAERSVQATAASVSIDVSNAFTPDNSGVSVTGTVYPIVIDVTTSTTLADLSSDALVRLGLVFDQIPEGLSYVTVDVTYDGVNYTQVGSIPSTSLGDKYVISDPFVLDANQQLKGVRITLNGTNPVTGYQIRRVALYHGGTHALERYALVRNGGRLFGDTTIDGVLTVRPDAVAATQDGIILEDRNGGAGEGLSINWRVGDHPGVDLVKILGRSESVGGSFRVFVNSADTGTPTERFKIDQNGIASITASSDKEPLVLTNAYGTFRFLPWTNGYDYIQTAQKLRLSALYGGQLAEILADTSQLSVTGKVYAPGFRIDATRDLGHIEEDGAFYRTGGQVYITVDDNLYIRDRGVGSKFHFDTNYGRLGINKTAPTKSLDVAGDIGATGVVTITRANPNDFLKLEDSTTGNTLAVRVVTGGDVFELVPITGGAYQWNKEVRFSLSTGVVDFDVTPVVAGTNTIWHAGNDGAGSGLDADLLDGKHASAFVLKAGDTMTGMLTFENGQGIAIKDSAGTARTFITIAANNQSVVGSLAHPLYFHSSQDPAYWDGTSAYTLWHAGNDGAGSGLDADLLDGYNAADFPRKAENATITGAWDINNRLKVNQLAVEGNTASRGLTSGSSIELAGSTSSALLSVQDGNGRIQLKWNATYGTNETFIVGGNEPAARWEFDPSSVGDQLFAIYFGDGTNNSAGAPITWQTILQVGTTVFAYKGNTIWHAGNDGPGSGLNADLLDGLDSSQFLRSDVDTTFNGTTLTVNGNIAMAAGKTVDGVDISDFKTKYDVHEHNGTDAPQIKSDNVLAKPNGGTAYTTNVQAYLDSLQNQIDNLIQGSTTATNIITNNLTVNTSFNAPGVTLNAGSVNLTAASSFGDGIQITDTTADHIKFVNGTTSSRIGFDGYYIRLYPYSTYPVIIDKGSNSGDSLHFYRPASTTEIATKVRFGHSGFYNKYLQVDSSAFKFWDDQAGAWAQINTGYIHSYSDVQADGKVKTNRLETLSGNLTLSGLGWGMVFEIDTDNNSADSYVWKGNGVEIMRLTDTGNLGIGTASPTEKLDVAGNVKANDIYINGQSVDKRFSHQGAKLVLGNNDWTNLVYFGANTVSYDATNRGVKISGANAWVKIRARIPVHPDRVYRVKAKVKKLSGGGNFYIGAASLDSNYNELNTDTANSYNYFGAQAAPQSAGNTYYYEGTISGYNTTTTGDRTKFDPEAKYFDLVIVANYNDTASPTETLIEWLELEEIPAFETSGSLNGVLVGNKADLGGNSFGGLSIAMPSGTTKWPFGIIKAGTPLFRVSDAGYVYASNEMKFKSGADDSAVAVGVNSTEKLGYLWAYAADHGLKLGTGNAERVRITSTGDVGIGTTAPSRKLHVAGEVRADTSSRQFILAESGVEKWHIESVGGLLRFVETNVTTRGEFTTSGQFKVYPATTKGIWVSRSDAAALNTPAEIYFDRTAAGAQYAAAVGMDADASRSFFIWVNGADRVKIDATTGVTTFTTTPTVNGNTIWHAGNDGAGSGLDADLLDGLNSSQFLRSDVDDTFSGNLTIAGKLTIGNDLYAKGHFWLHAYEGDGVSGTAYIQGRDNSGTSSIALQFRTQNAGTIVDAMYISASGNVGIRTKTPAYTLDVNGTANFSNALVGGNTIWHAGNDGAGSGLDADLLDGIQASSFLRSDTNDSFTGTLSYAVGAGTPLKFDSDFSYAKTITINDGDGNYNISANWNGSKQYQYGTTHGAARITLNVENTAGEIKLRVGPVGSAGSTITETYARVTPNQLRIQTPYGYIYMGPQNTGYGHFYTDRAKFYFNKPIVADGNGFYLYASSGDRGYAIDNAKPASAIGLFPGWSTSTLYINTYSNNGTKTNTYANVEIGGNVTVRGTTTATAFYQSSTKDVKTDIQKFVDSALAIIQQLTVKTFKYKDIENDKDHIGLIAEETPDLLLNTDGKSVDTGSLIGLLLKAVQELNERLKRLEVANASV